MYVLTGVFDYRSHRANGTKRRHGHHRSAASACTEPKLAPAPSMTGDVKKYAL